MHAYKSEIVHPPSPPPKRKSHRINVRDQRLSISYRAFLSISAAAHNDGDSKAADYEINARPSRAFMISLSVPPGVKGVVFALPRPREPSSVRAQTAGKRTTLTLSMPVDGFAVISDGM